MITENFHTVQVDVGHHQYPIHIGKGASSKLAADISLAQKIFVISDKTVFELHGEHLKRHIPNAEVLCIGEGEVAKSRETLFEILDWLLDKKATRSDVLIAFGGGIVGDITGFAASMMKRGMKFIQIPTTLLAQVDSSVGGKTAINTAHGKNLIGAFYQPQAVYIDLEFLRTLPKRQIAAGAAEVVKYGVIHDPNLFGYLEEQAPNILSLDMIALAHIITRSCQIKADIVAQDEMEKGQRALLNFGHTFGHALEALNGYTLDLLHGEAVAIGMGLATRYAIELGVCDATLAVRLDSLFNALDLPRFARESFASLPSGAAVLEAMTHDKKAKNAQLPLILTKGLGQAYIQPEADLSHLLKFLECEFTA